MPPHAACAVTKNSETDPYYPVFLQSCEDNDAAIALQLAPDRELGMLTYGLRRAVERGHLALANQLLGVGAKWDTRTVHLASRSHETVKWLIESGYDVNTSVARGNTLLLFVVQENDEPSIRLLLKLGANPNLGPPKKMTAPAMIMRPISNCGHTLNSAAVHCSPEIFALLLAHGAVLSNSTPLHRAAGSISDNRISMLEYLVGELGLDIHGMDSGPPIPDECCGREGTSLHCALRRKRYETAKWLLEHGADPDKGDSFGTPARALMRRLPDDNELVVLLREHRKNTKSIAHF
ncbi:uncharacterized protein J4E87_004737 [Alternaria ethzedia]|uniref:uncharacterized protein n=1 Tax=Alternaria ethzedia TaxID=181014 RepID=UPI0020C510A8|nr:uncharacterized protein J4E87_004737 [Alternaria ethzedia]KAI4626237.1 hypothetical protein J4E87_004737 [Alternaria ethzedia]